MTINVRRWAVVARFSGAALLVAVAFMHQAGAQSAGVDNGQATADAQVVACQQASADKTLLWRMESLVGVREALANGDTRFEAARNRLLADANEALTRLPDPVTNKTRLPPSGDRQDYMSLGPYWWPDPESSDGLPYLRRDGQVNPERDGDQFDRARLRQLINDVRTLALAHWFSEDSRYAGHAQTLLHAWFADPATRMNPNLNFGQSVPGRSDGRPYGIIDTIGLIQVVDAVNLLDLQGKLEPASAQAVRQWFGAYADWLVDTPMAREERAARNNHGSWYDAQLMAFSLAAGDCSRLALLLRDFRYRVGSQLQADGYMPAEQDRTRSLHYHLFNLNALLTSARLAEHFGVDLYNWRADNGASLVQSLHLLAGYAGREADWPYPRLDDRANVYLWETLSMAATAISAGWLSSAIKQASETDMHSLTLLLTGVIGLQQENEDE